MIGPMSRRASQLEHARSVITTMLARYVEKWCNALRKMGRAPPTEWRVDDGCWGQAHLMIVLADGAKLGGGCYQASE